MGGKYADGFCRTGTVIGEEFVAVISFPSPIGPTYQPLIIGGLPATEGFFRITAIIDEYADTPKEAFKIGYKYL